MISEPFFILIRYNLHLVCRELAEYIQPLLFFVIVMAIFPLVIGSDRHLLQSIGPGLIWIMVLLATLLNLPQLFIEDFKDGCLEQQLLSPFPLSLFILVRILVHWLVTTLPLIIISPLLILWFSIPAHVLMVLMFSLLLGTPVFSIIGAIVMALLVGLRQNGALLALLILPLVVPVLILGAGIATLVNEGQSYTAQLAWLGAMFCIALSIGPMVVAEALRIGIT